MSSSNPEKDRASSTDLDHTDHTDCLPTVTVVIAARPGQDDIQAVASSRALDYPSSLLEILIARGRHPAVQRNEAIRKARGDIIYFLDDDARPTPGALRQAVAHFAQPEVQMVGGPNLCPDTAPVLERIFATVLASALAFAASRARYHPVGLVRSTTEKELILCNLLGRRTALIAAGGFDESLYPNEENALMDELVKRGGRLIYDPQVFVYRRPRSSLGAFAKMVFRYGRGRAEQFRRHPTLGSVPNFVPPLFCLYVLALPWLGFLGLLPLAAYVCALLLQILLSLRDGQGWRSFAAVPFVVLTHLGYGIGFWCGLFTPLRSGRDRGGGADVVLETVRAG
jgi:cellulose synthase/poly-beta-1,6-N-acetylglucosamine synthase-like glycosyltransferase